MLNLAIIDDESLFRQYLRNSFDWTTLGFNICWEARDGEEALDLFKNVVPDLALIDITMPFMDGLRLSTKVKELYPSTYIVLVTGHEEFEYARKAIKLGVKDYILKPFNKEELIKTISEVKHLFDEANNKKLFSKLDKNEGTKNFYSNTLYEEILMDLKLQYKDSIIDKINLIFNEISEKQISIEFVYGISTSLIAVCLNFIDSSGHSIGQILGENNNIYDKLDNVEDLSELKVLIDNIFISTLNYFNSFGLSKGKKVVIQAKNYIDNNYHKDDLCLDKICQQVYVNESYLRSLFKKELGITISEYITSVRMNKAKELIKKGGIRFSDLCEAIGYSDPAYFSKCFKKYFGISPKDYETTLK